MQIITHMFYVGTSLGIEHCNVAVLYARSSYAWVNMVYTTIIN
jgi:hypothetical protein